MSCVFMSLTLYLWNRIGPELGDSNNVNFFLFPLLTSYFRRTLFSGDRRFLAVSLPRVSSEAVCSSFHLVRRFFLLNQGVPGKNSVQFSNLSNRSVKFDVKCSYYSGLSVTTDDAKPLLDVVDDSKSQQVVVLGGSGFVGSAVCKVAVSKGMKVTSLSRSGRPALSAPWVDQVSWVSGDVFHANWEEILAGATAVVSTVGGFGSEEEMQRINGEANVVAVNAAKEIGIPKFILISIHDYNLPPFLLQSAFFNAKRKAESEVLSKYPRSGVVLRPALTYGKTTVNGVEFHWDHIGEPVQKFLSDIENFTRPLSSIPGSDLILAPPVHVDDVAHAVVHALADDDVFGVFTIQQIKEAAAKAKA